MSIIQLEKFEFVLQKGTELGVRSFIPLITDRMEVRIERIRGKEDRWKKIVLEAVKQSGRSQIPSIEPPTKFDDAIARDRIKNRLRRRRPNGRPATGCTGHAFHRSRRRIQRTRTTTRSRIGRRFRATRSAAIARGDRRDRRAGDRRCEKWRHLIGLRARWPATL